MKRSFRRLGRRLKSKKAILFIAVLALITFGVLKVISNLNGQAVGTVNNIVSASIANKTNTKPITYNGQYLSFNYPSRYTPISTKLTGRIVEVFGLYSNDHSEISITLSLQPEALNADTGVTYRKQNPSTYSLISADSTSIYFESNLNGYEKDAFIAHGGLVASFVVTAPFKSAISNDFDTMIASLKWH